MLPSLNSLIIILAESAVTTTSSSATTTLSTFKHINVDQYDNDMFYCNNIK